MDWLAEGAATPRARESREMPPKAIGSAHSSRREVGCLKLRGRRPRTLRPRHCRVPESCCSMGAMAAPLSDESFSNCPRRRPLFWAFCKRASRSPWCCTTSSSASSSRSTSPTAFRSASAPAVLGRRDSQRRRQRASGRLAYHPELRCIATVPLQYVFHHRARTGKFLGCYG
jgi:hypothetical protein